MSSSSLPPDLPAMPEGMVDQFLASIRPHRQDDRELQRLQQNWIHDHPDYPLGTATINGLPALFVAISQRRYPDAALLAEELIRHAFPLDRLIYDGDNLLHNTLYHFDYHRKFEQQLPGWDLLFRTLLRCPALFVQHNHSRHLRYPTPFALALDRASSAVAIEILEHFQLADFDREQKVFDPYCDEIQHRGFSPYAMEQHEQLEQCWRTRYQSLLAQEISKPLPSRAPRERL